MVSANTLKFFSFLAGCLVFSIAVSSSAAMAQRGERWFQIEVSIFSNETQADRNEELWQADRLQAKYPNPVQRLSQLSDLLLIEDLISAASPEFQQSNAETQGNIDGEPLVLASAPIVARSGEGFRFFDFQRDSLVQLPATDSNFQQTNRAIERNADHRLLFHGLWRQPLQNPDQAVPIYIEGGQQYGEQHELQGTITLRFNDGRDRIVIDTDLWLAEFSAAVDPDGDWQLPVVPDQMKIENIVDLPGIQNALNTSGNQFIDYGINRIFHLEQSRDMRSTEFHYIDHPAMGVVILVEPYEAPALPAQ